MFSPSHLRLLSILAIVIAIAQANWLDAHVVRRQDTSSDGGLLSDIVGGVSSALDVSVGLGGGTTSTPSSSTPSTSAPATSTTPPSTSIPSSTPTSTPPTTSPSSSTPQSTSTPPSSTPPSSSSTPASTSSNDESTSSEASQTPFTTIIAFTTVVDGSTIVSSSTATSQTSKPTTDASLNGSSSTKSSGMSSSTKKTVIGVVVGVGGFIILAGLFVVAWRIWGRKKNEEYESDGLMGSSEIKMTSPGSSGGAGQTPFQSTLDQYHTPKNVNASSNF